MTFEHWRLVHRTATAVVGVVGLVHSSLTMVFYDSWSPDAVWFLGTGFALLLLAVMNWSHVGLGPCDLPTAPVVRWSNVVFALFGVGAVIAVAEPQAFVVLIGLVFQAVAGFVTLKAPEVTSEAL